MLGLLLIGLFAGLSHSACLPASSLGLTYCNFLDYSVESTYAAQLDASIASALVGIGGLGGSNSACMAAYRNLICYSAFPSCNQPRPLCVSTCVDVFSQCGFFYGGGACYSGIGGQSYVIDGTAPCLGSPMQPPLTCRVPSATELPFCSADFGFQYTVPLPSNTTQARQALTLIDNIARGFYQGVASSYNQASVDVPAATKLACLRTYKQYVCGFTVTQCRNGNPYDGVLPCDYSCNDLIVTCPELGALIASGTGCVGNFFPPPAGQCPPGGQYRCGYVFGDPHFTTPDNAEYSYNPVGEYWLSKGLGSNTLGVQIRFEPCHPGGTATCTAALSFQVGPTDVVQLTLNPVGDGSLLLTQNGASASTPLTVNGNVFKRTNGLYGSAGAWVINLSQNIIFTVAERPSGHPSVVACFHVSNLGTIAGLFGYFDGNFLNDFKVSPAATGSAVIAASSSYEIIGQSFAETWRTTSTESTMVYAAGETWADWNDLTFVQTYLDLSAFTPTPDAVQACQGLEGNFLTGCLFDVSTTSDTSFAASAMDAMNSFGNMTVLYAQGTSAAASVAPAVAMVGLVGVLATVLALL